MTRHSHNLYDSTSKMGPCRHQWKGFLSICDRRWGTWTDDCNRTGRVQVVGMTGNWRVRLPRQPSNLLRWSRFWLCELHRPNLRFPLRSSHSSRRMCRTNVLGPFLREPGELEDGRTVAISIQCLKSYNFFITKKNLPELIHTSSRTQFSGIVAQPPARFHLLRLPQVVRASNAWSNHQQH